MPNRAVRPVPAKSATVADLPPIARATPITHADLLALITGRAEIETMIERLVDILDATDGDCDLEDDDPGEPIGDDEPSLGANAAMNQSRWGAIGWQAAGGVDLEVDRADYEDNGDREEGDNGIADEGGLNEQMSRFVWGDSANA